MNPHLNHRIDSLALDHRRGASEIVEDAVSLLIDIARVGVDDSTEGDLLWRRAIKRLAQGQPSMAPVLNLLNRVSLARTKFQDDWKGLATETVALLLSRKEHLDAMVRNVDQLPRVNGTLMTFSNSSTVRRLIIASHKLGGIERVLCSEGRPIMEGLDLARKLNSVGIDVTLYTDAALMSRIVKADAVWVGGDAFSYRGLVNKVGTRALGMLAQKQGIPMISLISSDKLLAPELIPYFSFLPQNPREIASGEAQGINVVNEYYERIPHNLIDYIFTESGLSTPEMLIQNIRHEPICASFQELVQPR